MKKNSAFGFALVCSVLLAACGSNTKRIIVFGNTDMQINQDAKTIVQKDTEGHVDKEISYSAGGELQLHVQQKDGSSTNIPLTEPGLYILNVKAKDTIIGGYQKFSTPEEANRVITQEQLQHDIDSLQQLLTGSNANAANRTFFIPPNKAVKISSNADAIVIGPYHQLTTIENKGNKPPEVYRFYTINEVRETLARLEKLTGKEEQ